MKKLLWLFLLFQTSGFGQQEKPLWKNHEFFIGPNHTWFPASLTPDFRGKAGFDFGVKRSFNPDRGIHFVLGLEAGFSNYEYDYYNVSSSSFIRYYTDVAISKMMVSTSFDFRVYFSSGRRFFLEMGPYVDFNVFKELRGTRHIEGSSPVFVREKAESLPVNLGFNFGFGFNFPISDYCLLLKPDLKWNFLPQMLPDQHGFDNFTYTRLLLIIKKN